jgi:hypothetical protein
MRGVPVFHTSLLPRAGNDDKALRAHAVEDVLHDALGAGVGAAGGVVDGGALRASTHQQVAALFFFAVVGGAAV